MLDTETNLELLASRFQTPSKRMDIRYYKRRTGYCIGTSSIALHAGSFPSMTPDNLAINEFV